MDWLASPIVYREDEAVMERWREMRPDYYTPRRVWYAFRGMARSVAQKSLSSTTIQHKAYLYVLRSLLAVRWVEQTASEPVPMAFDRLVASCVDDASLREAVDDLVARKRSGRELGEGPRLPVIHDAIDAELDRLDDATPPAGRSTNPVEPLNQFFRSVLDRQDAG
jgi:predicted nucleotidyltransferase